MTDLKRLTRQLDSSTPPATPKKPKRKRSNSTTILVFVLLSLLCVIVFVIPLIFFRLLSRSQPQNVDSPSPIALIPTNTSDTSKIAQQDEVGTLPGLQASDIKVSLEQRDFTCTSAEIHEDKFYSWTCKLETAEYSVETNIYGDTLQTVDYVSVYTMDFGSNDQLLATIVGFIATVPYQKAQPQEARTWIEDNYFSNKKAEKTFGGVKYGLYGEVRNKNLAIGEFKW